MKYEISINGPGHPGETNDFCQRKGGRNAASGHRFDIT
jgi:hypothetical protein